MSQKVMRVVGDPKDVRLECRVCGIVVSPEILPGGRLRRGSWQCPRGCRVPDGAPSELDAATGRWDLSR